MSYVDTISVQMLFTFIILIQVLRTLVLVNLETQEHGVESKQNLTNVFCYVLIVMPKYMLGALSFQMICSPTPI